MASAWSARAEASAASSVRMAGKPCSSVDPAWASRLLCAAAAAARPALSCSVVRYPASAWSPQARASFQSLVGKAASASSAAGSRSSVRNPAWLPTSHPLVAPAGRALLATAPTDAMASAWSARAEASAASSVRMAGKPCSSVDPAWASRLLCAAAAAARLAKPFSAVRYPAAAWSPQAWASFQSLVGKAASASSAAGSDSFVIPVVGQLLAAAFVPRASEPTHTSPVAVIPKWSVPLSATAKFPLEPIIIRAASFPPADILMRGRAVVVAFVMPSR